MRKTEFYGIIIGIVLVFGWTSIYFYGLNDMKIKELNNRQTETETAIKILNDRTERDTVVINLNLKQK